MSAATTTTDAGGTLRPPDRPAPKRRARGTRRQIDRGVWVHAYGRAVPGLDPTGGPSVLRLTRGDWKDRGSCTSADQKPWFSAPESDLARAARRACHSCPVRDLCLAAGLVFHEEFGIWGGLTPEQRLPLLQRLTAGEPLGAVLTDALETVTEAA